MPAVTLVPVVEGFGDVDATPILLRRMAAEIVPEQYVEILRPIRVKRSRVVLPGQLENYVDLAARKRPIAGPAHR